MNLSISDVPLTTVDIGTMPSQAASDLEIVVPQGQPISASDEDLTTQVDLVQQSDQDQELDQSATVIAAALMSLQAAQALAVVTLGPESEDRKKRS